jgi:hypothetical protein
MAASAQGYYMKPGAMGGGGNSFGDLTFDNIGGVACDPTEKSNGDASTDNTTCGNANGDYTISDAGDDFTLVGVPAQAGGSITATVSKDDIVMNPYDGSGS